ncbi:MAG: aminoacetone oxidase family FAD-binding enzyme [candidate division Zixibacteria bacterium]|nr:aminoacetone oxidase family FAD-binding enzyme [candidate division Zixibacteria bacterium]
MAKRIAIIGAGPAGMAAAYFAAEGGAEVDLYDKNPVIGKKYVYVPWEGCELTHEGNTEDFMENYARGAEFLTYSLDKFTSKDAVKLLKKLGVKVTTNEDGVIIPTNGDTQELKKAFEEKLQELNVNLCVSSKVQEILADGRKITGIKVHNKEVKYDKVIIATGGAARPKLGASDDGYEFAKEFGHSITKPLPAISEVETNEKLGKFLSGLEVSSVAVSVYRNKHKHLERNGKILFTDHGLMGDAILFLSGIISRLSENNKVEISIDFVPLKSKEMIDRDLVAKSSLNSSHLVGDILKEYLDPRLLPVMTRFYRIQETKPMSHITNLERKSLVLFLKDFRVTVKRVKPFFAAFYTSGGVDVEEINPKTMESKLVKGLYFCGEVLDVDGGPGGYNMHSAFATGYTAGKAVSRGAKTKKAKKKSSASKKAAKKSDKGDQQEAEEVDDQSSIKVA